MEPSVPASTDYYRRNREKCAADQRAARARKPDRYAFLMQRSNARQRGIPWGFESFEQWRRWWIVGGYDFFPMRGCSSPGLVMSRYGDVGPYSPENCYINTCEANAREGGRKCSNASIGSATSVQ